MAAGLLALLVAGGLLAPPAIERVRLRQAAALWREGQDLAARGDDAAAVARYSAAIELGAKEAGLYLDRAEAQRRLGAVDAALADLAAAASLDAQRLPEIRRRLYADPVLFDYFIVHMAEHGLLGWQIGASVHETMGLNIDPGNPQGNPSPAQLRALGAAWVRFSFRDDGECEEPSAERLAFYVRTLRDLNAAGIRVLLILSYETCPHPPAFADGDAAWDAYTQRFARFSGQIAAALGEEGQAYQIWNEPDFVAPLPGYDPRILPAVYARMLAATYRTIKAVSGATVVTGGLNSGDAGWLAQVAAAQGGRLPADAVGLQPYGQRPAPDWPDRAWGFGEIGELIERYRQVTDLPMWITEAGLDSDDQALQAAYLKRFYQSVISRYPGTVAHVFWFAYSDGMVAPFGLVDAAGQPKSAYGAYQQIALVTPVWPGREQPRVAHDDPGLLGEFAQINSQERRLCKPATWYKR
jgi:hypothetical protein